MENGDQAKQGSVGGWRGGAGAGALLRTMNGGLVRIRKESVPSLFGGSWTDLPALTAVLPFSSHELVHKPDAFCCFCSFKSAEKVKKQPPPPTHTPPALKENKTRHPFSPAAYDGELSGGAAASRADTVKLFFNGKTYSQFGRGGEHACVIPVPFAAGDMAFVGSGSEATPGRG